MKLCNPFHLNNISEKEEIKTKIFGIQLYTKVEGKVPIVSLFIAREMREITCWINKQRGRGQKAIKLWLVTAHYLFFVIVKVLYR